MSTETGRPRYIDPAMDIEVIQAPAPCVHCGQELIWNHPRKVWSARREPGLGWCSLRPADPGDDRTHVPGSALYARTEDAR